MLPVTAYDAVSLVGLVSTMFASGELTVIPLTMLPVPVAVVLSVTTGVVAPAPSGAPAV